MRAVTHDEHAVSLSAELDAAAALLGAAGIDTAIDMQVPELAHPTEEVFAWAVREGATNTLRHSDAAHWNVSVARRGTAVRLEMVNDGAPDRIGSGSGLTGLTERGRRALRARHRRPRRRRPLPAPGGDPGGRGVIRVLIAEDMHLIRGALVALLSLEPDMEIVAELERGDEIVSTAVEVQPDVAVVDIDLPGCDGLTAAEQLYEKVPDCRTLVLTGMSQPGNLLRALQVHVRGFIIKDAPADTLADGIRRVAAGERVIDPDLVAAALETGASPLTARESDVLRAADDGISTDEIASLLSLSPATVRNYLSNAITKVGARNRIDAIRISRDAGWI